MNYYDARQTKDKAGWHYTCMNDGQIWPVGYCRDHEPHDTQDEARECFRAWLLDNAKYDRPRFSNALYRCDVEGCREFTDGGATDGHNSPYTLCGQHRNRETLKTLIGPVGQITSSW
jgi:hypothetical protein